MEETTPQSPPPPSRKKIRLTKSEAYAMAISSPRKRRLAFGLVGLLILAALGNVLWHFQDWWLPYWLPAGGEPVPLAAAPPAEPAESPSPAAGQPAPPAAAAEPDVAAPETAPLDFLSAAAWDHPQFLQGVRLFNQALDRYRTFQRDRRPADLPKQIEEGALQAAMAFDQLRAEAPASVPLADYVACCQKLVVETRDLCRPPSATASSTVPRPSPPSAAARPAAPAPRPGEAWQEPDYLQAAKLFNQALEQYRQFLADKSRTELLKPIEETAFQAAKKFEALKELAPTNVPIGDHITQCYKLISDCRRQNLESAPPENGDAPGRGTVGPSRRPALPAYQPPPPP